MIQTPNLSAALFKYLSVREPERFSHGEYLHVTDLYNNCFRQIYYSRKLNTPVERYIPATLRMLFEMGIAIEDKVRSYLLSMDIVYSEKQVLKDEDLKLVGAPDIRLKNDQIVDIKGMNPGVFKFTAKRPLPRHEFQIRMYLWLDGSQVGKLLSATWGDKEKIPFRDHDVRYDIKTVELVKKKVSQLREAETGGRLPERVCKSEQDSKAVLCPFARQCFDEDGELTKTIAEELV